MSGGLSTQACCAILGLTLTACAVSPGSERSSALERWVDQTLVPELSRQLSAHPRFKGHPVLVVAMDGEHVRPEIDHLTEEIRGSLSEALVQRPGANLIWRPAATPWRSYGEQETIPCHKVQIARYLVGIDTTLSPADGSLHVSVGALDLVEREWVSGLRWSWQGRATRAQRQAVQRRRADELLRGRRFLPFESSQPDLLASYLAYQVGCELRRHPDVDEMTVLADALAARNATFFDTTRNLLDNYLGRFENVALTDDPQRATLALEAEMHGLGGDLHQVWVAVRDRTEGHYIRGVGAQAYVRLEPGASARPAGRQASAQPAPRNAGSAARAPLVESFRVLSQSGPARCTPSVSRAWVEAARRTTSTDVAACKTLVLTVGRPAHILLVGQGPGGDIHWIAPSPCARSPGAAWVSAGETFHYPVAPGTAPGQVYAIAIEAGAGTDTPAASARALCEGQRLARLTRTDWHAYLDALRGPGVGRALEWRRVRF